MKKLEDIKLAIVVSEFNTTITSSLKKSAINYFISEKGNEYMLFSKKQAESLL